MPPQNIPPDGKVHRFKGASKNGLSGWGVNYGDFGAKGDWATGEKETFFHGRRPSKRTKKMIIKRIEEDKQKLERRAANECYDIWQHAIECYTHPYLDKKQVDSFDLKLSIDDKLLIPMHDINGQIWSLQTIDKSGFKLFHKDGRKKGMFYLMGDFADPLFVCEGYATGASIAMAAKVCVAVAFDAGNLRNVVEELRKIEPTRSITIAGDFDKWKPHLGNSGEYHAMECRKDFNCGVVFPSFKDETTKPTDFNDLHCLEGLGVVQDQIMGVLSQ